MTTIPVPIPEVLLPTQELEHRLASPNYRCQSDHLNHLYRDDCRWPFTCCSTRRPTIPDESVLVAATPGYPLPEPHSPPSRGGKKRGGGGGEDSTPKRSKQATE